MTPRGHWQARLPGDCRLCINTWTADPERYGAGRAWGSDGNERSTWSPNTRRTNKSRRTRGQRFGKRQSILVSAKTGTYYTWLTQNLTQEHNTVYSIHGQRHMQIKVPVTMGTLDAWAMVDSGATGNFVSERFVCDNQIWMTQKAHPYRVSNMDGTPNKGNGGWVTHEASIWMEYKAFEGLIIWDIATIGSVAIILGMP